MTTDEKKIVELLDVTEPIKSITLITESSEDKEIDVKLGPSSYRCMLINDEPGRTFYFKQGIICLIT